MGGSDVVSRGTLGNGVGVPRPARRPQIYAMSAQVLISCDCGSPIPLMLTLIPGADWFVICQACRKRWYVDRIEYTGHRGERLSDEDRRKAETLSIGLHGDVPAIVGVSGVIKP